MTSGIACNTRCLISPLSGVQRYTMELLARFGDAVTPCAPSRRLSAVRGHLWEQIVLPRRTHGSLLWSPANTGPLAVAEQVVTLHDMAALEHPEWVSRKFAALYGYLLPRLARKVRHVLTISQFSKERILACTGIAEQRVTVIANGVDARFAPASELEQAEVRGLLGIGDRRYVLSLGSLEPRKNLSTLLQAWQRLADRLPSDVWLVLAGAKGNEAIFRHVPSLDSVPPRVLLAGHVEDRLLPALYSAAECFVYPSLYEGFGMPPLEAMACGCPVVVSRLASLPEVCEDAAAYCEAGDPCDLASIVRRLYDDGGLRLHMRQVGLARAANFRWMGCAARHIQYLEQLLCSDIKLEKTSMGVS